MEQPDKPGEPVRYVGGLNDVPRPPAWPYLALAGILVLLLAGGVVLWNPIRSLGRSAGETIAPYSLALTSARWSSEQKITGVPVRLTLTVENADQRTVNGLTLTFIQLDPGWNLVRATSERSGGEIQGTSIFFADVIPPGGSATASITLVPTRAMDTEVDITLTPGQSKSPARVGLANGTAAAAIAFAAKVREPTVADADARLTAIFNPEAPLGQLAQWNVHVANVGPIDIDRIRLRFPSNAGSYLDLTYLPPQAKLLSDGLTLEYPTTLPPGGQTILVIGVVPKQSGHFTFPILVYLGESTLPLSAADGGPPLTIDLRVN